MNADIRIICENLGSEFHVPMGTPLLEIARHLTPGAHPFLAALVDNRIKELNYRVYTPVSIRFIDITSFAGIRVYQRTACFLLQKAVKDLYPGQKLHIRHSMGQSGFYCEIEGIASFDAERAGRLRHHMRELVLRNLPITRQRMLTSEVRARYLEEGFSDKVELLDTRPRLYSDLYTLDDTAGYFYGSLAPSTGYVTLFDIEPYYSGFYLALPLRTAPDTLDRDVQQEKMFGIFQEYQSWVALMGVPTIGAVNARALSGDAGGMIKIAEAFHERKFASLANAILDANRRNGTRMVLISGPSSSGKTTSAKRLSIQLGVLGLHPVMISLDDYFVDREKTPKDENGDYDYEALEAIDLELFNDHLRRLMRGESVDIPRYDFISGRRMQHNNPLTLEVAMDNITRIATTDNRLLRRLTRDYRQRGTDALATLSRWSSVRRGEERHIFPYQENADVMLNSSLFYEISVLKPFAEKILREIPNTVPEYSEARRMLKFLDNFIPIAPDEVPPTSILREFIGGSSFTY